jgi:cellulose synthase/poly-beta-1,6-N-acetylglucosamine synthase-like glycosyltransferase
VARYAALGHPIVYIHRTNRYGYKAGALDAGLKVAKGEFVAIFDADFVPPHDWLMKVVHHFAEPGSAWCRRAGPTSTATTAC